MGTGQFQTTALAPGLVLAGSMIYASQGAIFALDARDGARQWHTFTSTSVTMAAGMRIHSFTVQRSGSPGGNP